LTKVDAILTAKKLQRSSCDDEVGLEWIVFLGGITSLHR
jgi:hypothetical protein